MENFKTMYGVEYFNQRTESGNFDIFETLEAARDFIKSEKFRTTFILFYIFKADFNTKHIYQSQDGSWNYFNVSDLYQNDEELLLPKNFLD